MVAEGCPFEGVLYGGLMNPRPHLGGLGTLHLLEDIFRGIMNGRILKGALYQ